MEHEQTRPPVVSPDGKFYWDGSQWQPMPNSGPERDGSWVPLVVLGLAALFVLFVVFGGFAMKAADDEQDDLKNFNDQYLCERTGGENC